MLGDHTRQGGGALWNVTVSLLTSYLGDSSQCVRVYTQISIIPVVEILFHESTTYPATKKYTHFFNSQEINETPCIRKVRLDCPPDAHWDYAGIFAVEVRFQIQDQFWIPQPILHGTKYLIFCKTSKRARYASFRDMAFPGFLGTKLALWRAQIKFLLGWKHTTTILSSIRKPAWLS